MPKGMGNARWLCTTIASVVVACGRPVHLYLRRRCECDLCNLDSGPPADNLDAQVRMGLSVLAVPFSTHSLCVSDGNSGGLMPFVLCHYRY